jgi:hypothetical protein
LPEARAPANPTSFAILFIAANNQLQSPSAEDDVLSSAGRDQIAADETNENSTRMKSNACIVSAQLC